MQREIKFRGKRVDNGEWVEGSLIKCASGIYILEENADLDLRPKYHSQGMGCGLEDRNITDRCDAMYHGYEKAVEQFEEVLPCYYQVIPETVAQFTGLTDKNGKEVYEGDLIMFVKKQTDGFHCAGGSYKSELNEQYKAEVKFRYGSYLLSGYYYPGSIHLHEISNSWNEEKKLPAIKDIRVHEDRIGGYDNALYSDFEIIGNIHDNPELLTQQQTQ